MKSNELLDKVLRDVSSDTTHEQDPSKVCVKGLTFPQGRDTWSPGLICAVLALESLTGIQIPGYLEDQFDAAVTAGNERVARNMAGLIEKKLREAV